MTDASGLNETAARDPRDTGETSEPRGSFTFDEEAVPDDVPPSLLSYFETSKGRAAACEKFILEEREDFTSSHRTDDTMRPAKQVTRATGKEKDDDSSSDGAHFLVPPPTETDAFITRRASACPDGDDGHGGCEKDLESEAGTLGSSTKEEETRRERGEERRREEVKREERRRQRERDFQEELRRIMEAEKLHQKELEMMERRAQEKLEQEFLLQQEMISNLQKRVEEERRRREEEEQRRMRKEREEKKRKEEEERRKREEEDRRMREEREEKKRKEEEERRRREEEEQRRMREEREEKKRKEEEERRKREEEDRRSREEREEKKRKEEEERRRREEEEQRRMREEREEKKREEEMRKRKEDEERRKEEEMRLEQMHRKKKEEEQRKREEEEERKREEEKNKIEEDMKKEEEERRNREIRLKEEEKRKQVEEEEERKRKENEEKIKEKKRKREEEEMREREEMIELARKKVEEDKSRENEEEKDCEEEEGRTKVPEMRSKEEERKTEEETKEEVEKKMIEQVKRKEVETREAEETQLKEDEEKREEEEERKRQEEEMRLGTEEGQKEVKEADDGKMEDKKQEEDAREREEADETQIKEEVRAEEEEEEVRAEEEEEEKEEKEEEEEEREKDGIKTQDQRNSLTPEPEPGAALTSSSSGPGADPNERAGRTPAPPSPLPEHTEQKRLSWMKDCVPWSRLSLQNRSKPEGSRSGARRRRRGAGEAGVPPPPLSPRALLRSTGCTSLQEVTSVTLEDLPGFSPSTLAQCARLRSLTVRRCGLTSLRGLNRLQQLCYVDAQENDISSVDFENMSCLRVLRLGRNKLTSIHGLSGAENVDVLDLSHNSIARIAGLESARRLQRLSLDHNRLISTAGLRDVCTLLHLDCSHNHLASVEGLESCALLQTLDLRGNGLAEPPSLNNHVLLHELRLDDNSIASLRGLAACWLPLLRRFTAAQNRITLLPPMSDLVSLADLDLRFNCLSELQNVSESLEGCPVLREVHLAGNPLERESGWRATLQRAAGGLRAVDGEETDSSRSPGGFLAFCRAQMKRTADLQRRHRGELSDASSHLDAVKTSCRHFAETLELAVDQRLAHERGDDGATGAASSLDTEELAEHRGDATPEGNRPTRGRRDAAAEVWTTGLRSVATVGEPAPSRPEAAPVSDRRDPRSAAAVVIQRRWRKRRRRRGNVGGPPAAERDGGERGGDGGEPESGPSHVNGSAAGEDRAAAVIQALWRGVALRRRLASALAAVTCADAGEDETLEEVDVDEFALDELPAFFPGPPRRTPPSPLPPLRRPKQAWASGERPSSTGPSSGRSRPPASPSPLGALHARSEKILEEWGFTDGRTALLMLKRAQRMKAQRTRRDPSGRRLASFRNCNYRQTPAEAGSGPAPHDTGRATASDAEPGLQRAERAERAERARRAESERFFLPEIGPDVLKGGRPQLLADPGYAQRRHHASGSRANSSSSAARPSAERNYPCRNSAGHARKEAPSPERTASAPSRRERISFRDDPVRLSGGWGGGKKRDRVRK